MEQHYWDKADSFASPLLGQVYRMYASAPDFKNPNACWMVAAGASMLLLPDGSGRLIVSKKSRRDGELAVRCATIPLKLAGTDYSAQRCIAIELSQFKDRCVLHGESGQSSAKEACLIMDAFACDILDEDDGYQLKIYPSLGGHIFNYGDKEEGEEETTLATDIVMTTPNCDELGHYLFRKTGAVLASDAVDAAVAEEVAAWNAILSGPKIAVGDKVRTRMAFESATEGGGTLSLGLVGEVKQLDEDGDAEVDFGSERGVHMIFASHFVCLSKE